MAGAAVRDILGDSWSAKCCVFFVENASPGWDESGLRSGGGEMRILSSDYPRISSDYPRIYARISSNRLLSIGGNTSDTFA